MNLKEFYKGKTTYLRIDKLGQGQFGQVIKVRDFQGNFYAIKVNNLDAYDSNSLKYLDSEKEIFQILSKQQKHPNIVNCHEAISDSEFVFEFCNGGSLLSYAADNKSFISRNEQQLKIILAQLVNGLNYLHGLGIVHRDLKPDNVLVSVVGGKTCLKISDFGFAISAQSQMLKSNVGTPIFKAHEVGTSATYDEKVDIYSLAATLYSMAMPKGEGEFVKLNKKFALLPEKIQTLSKSDEYKDLLIRMSHKEPNNRISLKEITDHPFLLSRNVNLLIYSKDFSQTSITVQKAKQLVFERLYDGLDLDQYIILCSYLGSTEIYPLRDDEFYPIYTIENLILVSVKEQVQFPKMPSVLTNKDFQWTNKTTIKTKVENCISIVKYFLFVQNFLSIYQVVYDVYLHRINNLNIMSTLQSLHKNMEKYKLSFEVLKNLKEMDEHGNDSETLLIDRLPSFIKSFINNSKVFQFNNLITEKNQIEEQYSQFKLIRDQFDFNSINMSITDVLIKLEVILSDMDGIELENSDEYEFVHHNFHTILALFDNFIRLKFSFDPIIVNLTFLLQSFEHIQFLAKYNLSNLPKENELCFEISKIPHYYILTKNELKRRHTWNSEFHKLCSQYAKNIQEYIEKDSNTKNQFNKTINNSNVYQPKQQNLSKEPIENPLKMFLIQNEDEDGFVIVDSKMFVDKEQTTQKQIDKIQNQHLQYIKNNPINFNVNNYGNNSSNNSNNNNNNSNNSNNKDVLVKEIEKITKEGKVIIENILAQNQILGQEISVLKNRQTSYNELEKINNSLQEEVALLTPIHQGLQERVSNMVYPIGVELIDPQTKKLVDLETVIEKKKSEIEGVNQKKELVEKNLNEFIQNQNNLIQEYEKNRLLYETSKKNIQEYQVQINHCRENESVQYNTLNKSFTNEKESYQKQCSIKNDSIRKLKIQVKDEENRLQDLTKDENDKVKFDALQKTLKERDLEIESLSVKLAELEKIARNLEQNN